MATVSVSVSTISLKLYRSWLFNWEIGWYDSVYDPELGTQPCIFTSVTPVR